MPIDRAMRGRLVRRAMLAAGVAAAASTACAQSARGERDDSLRAGGEAADTGAAGRGISPSGTASTPTILVDSARLHRAESLGTKPARPLPPEPQADTVPRYRPPERRRDIPPVNYRRTGKDSSAKDSAAKDTTRMM